MRDASDDADEPVIEPPWWTPERRTRRRAPLTRAKIIDAALRIVDKEGVDALTVRRLGEELDTGSATLYSYLSGKDEIGQLVYDHVMGGIVLPEPDPANWQEQVKDLGRQSYRLLVRHNDLVRLSLGQVPVGPNMLRVMEWLMALLTSAGMPDQAAHYAGDLLGRVIDASVLEVTAVGGPPPAEVAEYFRSLPADRFPHVLGAVPRTGADPKAFERDDDARFEFALEVVVRGLSSYAEPSKRRARRRSSS